MQQDTISDLLPVGSLVVQDIEVGESANKEMVRGETLGIDVMAAVPRIQLDVVKNLFWGARNVDFFPPVPVRLSIMGVDAATSPVPTGYFKDLSLIKNSVGSLASVDEATPPFPTGYFEDLSPAAISVGNLTGVDEATPLFPTGYFEDLSPITSSDGNITSGMSLDCKQI